MMQTLKLSDDLFASLDDGSKRGTIRAGIRDISIGELTFEAASGADIRRHVNVEWVKHVLTADLTNEHAALDGYSDVVDLWRALRKFYPNLAGADWVTVIEFSK